MRYFAYLTVTSHGLPQKSGDCSLADTERLGTLHESQLIFPNAAHENEELYSEFKAAGIDDVICLFVNDGQISDKSVATSVDDSQQGQPKNQIDKNHVSDPVKGGPCCRPVFDANRLLENRIRAVVQIDEQTDHK